MNASILDSLFCVSSLMLRVPYLLLQAYVQDKIADTEVIDMIWRNLLQGKVTFLHYNKHEAISPMCGMLSGTLLVRRIPSPDPMYALQCRNIRSINFMLFWYWLHKFSFSLIHLTSSIVQQGHVYFIRWLINQIILSNFIFTL